MNTRFPPRSLSNGGYTSTSIWQYPQVATNVATNLAAVLQVLCASSASIIITKNYKNNRTLYICKLKGLQATVAREQGIYASSLFYVPTYVQHETNFHWENPRHRPEHIDACAQKNAPKSTVIALTTACECMRHGLVIAGISHLIL